MMLGVTTIELLMQHPYEGTTLRVLMYILLTTDSSCTIKVRQVDIARELNVGRPVISKSFKRLAADNLIYKAGNTWLMNPQTGFTGTGEQHQQAVANTPPAIRLRTPLRPVHDRGEAT